MKGKYITTQIRITSLSQTTVNKKDIHELLAETVAERKQIIREMERMIQRTRIVAYLNFTQAA